MNIFYKSKEHCDNAKETYFQHMLVAIKISSSLLLASLMGFIHSIIPALFEKSASNKITNLYVKKINDKKYRLYAGPFKNFNALKNTYISLNKLGFENLNINRESR